MPSPPHRPGYRPPPPPSLLTVPRPSVSQKSSPHVSAPSTLPLSAPTTPANFHRLLPTTTAPSPSPPPPPPLPPKPPIPVSDSLHVDYSPPTPPSASPSSPSSDLALHLGSSSRHRLPSSSPLDPSHPASPSDSDEEDKYRKPTRSSSRRRQHTANGHHPATPLTSPYTYALALFTLLVLAALFYSPSARPLPSTPLPHHPAVSPASHQSPAVVASPAVGWGGAGGGGGAGRSPALSPPSVPSPHAVIPASPDDGDWRRQICGDNPSTSDALLCDDPSHPLISPLSPHPTPPTTPSPLTSSDLTLFTVFTPEPDTSHSHTSWLRSMYSWTLQVPDGHHILVLVRQADDCAHLRDLPIEVTCRVSACFRGGGGAGGGDVGGGAEEEAPYLRCVLEDANRRADTQLMVYVEDHIVLFNDFVPALLKVASRLPQFFLVGSSTSLTLTVDAALDLKTWQKDVEAATFLDSSDAGAEREHARHVGSNHSHSLHYFAYSRHHLDLSTFSPSILMGSGAYYGHQWEKILVAYLLLQDRVTLVDVTQAVTAVEMTHQDTSNLTESINSLNLLTALNSSTVPHLSLGRLENSHFVLIGKCPTCSLKENREADLPLILIRHANSARQVIVILVNSVYLSLAFNWICRARFLGLDNYVMLAEDRVSYRILRKMNVPVVLRKDAPYMKPAAVTGSAEFQETLYLRALFFKEVVNLGFHLILSHLDTIWLEDPLPAMAASDCDMHVQMEGGTRADGGILTVRSSPLGLQFAKDYLVCEQENWEFITVHGKSRFFYSDDPDMNCVDLISQRLVRRNHLKRCLLDRSRYVGEHTFFDRQSSQHRAIFPAFVHINQASGLHNKTKVFLDWDLWAVDDAAMVSIPSLRQAHAHGNIQCKAPPKQLDPPLFEERDAMRLIVNVLASTEHFALSQTLDHLAAADYDARFPIDLRLTIQQPEHDSATNTRQYVKTVTVARDFEWTAGKKTLIFLDSHVGATDRWLDHWTLGGDDDGEQIFQLALQAGQSLSVTWFTWVRAALNAYYYDPFQYQPELMGLHLQHQFTIVGESPSARFGSRVPSTVLSASANASSVPALYHYQFLPLFGTLFFPQHFHSFLHWYAAQNHSTVISPSSSSSSPITANSDDPTSPHPSFSPIACVPTLISNAWYKGDPIHFWYAWLIRFTFESGWYALYTNFISPQDRKPRALAVDQTPLAGQLTVSLIKKLSGKESTFPPSSSLELYDLHFTRFTQDRRMLAVRKQLFPPVAAGRRSTAEELQVEGEREAERERDRAQWAKERGGGGADADEVDDTQGGLWHRIAMRRREVQLAEIADEQVVGEEVDEVPLLDAAAAAADDVITPTDLVIDMMKTIMTESDDLNADDRLSPSSLDSSHYRQQLDRLAMKLRQIKAGELHRHVHVRGSERDRCFVIGDQVAEPVSDVAVVVDVIADLPPPYNSSLTLPELYTTIYTSVTSRLPAKAGEPITDPLCRFIVYRPTTAAINFDRHLRGLYFAFLTALISQRVFLIDLPDFDAMYDCPFPGVKWRYSDFARYFVGGKERSHAGVVSVDELTSKKITAELRTRFVNDIYPQQLLYHIDAVSHDRLMFTNTAYRPYALAMFDTHSRMKRTGLLMRTLQSRPKNGLIQQSKDLQRSLGLTHVKYSICVHLVAPPERMKKATDVEPLPGVSDAHWDCIQSQLLHLGFTRDDVVIFFTSNSPLQASIDVGATQLGRYGRVVGARELYEANTTTWGMSNVSVRASTLRDEVSGALLYDSYLVNQFAFGDCDVSVSSGTTYGIFGAARTGFSRRAYVYRAGREEKRDKAGKVVLPAETDYCGPMHRIDQVRENDINF